MHEIEEWIDEAIQNNSLQVRRIPSDEALKVVSETTATYVRNRPRSWWLDLAVDAKRMSSEGLPLAMVVPSEQGDVYLIPETETAELPVYSGSVAALDRLIGECPFFEYYVVAPDRRWLLIESDHNEYFLCGDLPLSKTQI